MKSYSKDITTEKILIVVSFLFVALLVFYRIQDADFFWHIANGKAMIELGRIVNEEIFSYTRPGVIFSNHEWLSQILFSSTVLPFDQVRLFLLQILIENDCREYYWLNTDLREVA